MGRSRPRVRAAARDVRPPHLHRHLDHGVHVADADVLRPQRTLSRSPEAVPRPDVRIGGPRRVDQRAGGDCVAFSLVRAVPSRQPRAVARSSDDDSAGRRDRRRDRHSVVRSALSEHGWTYITSFFISENLERYTSGLGVRQQRGFTFYLPVVLSDSFPVSIFLFTGVAMWRRQRDRTQTLLWCWILAIVGFFSFSAASRICTSSRSSRQWPASGVPPSSG